MRDSRRRWSPSAARARSPSARCRPPGADRARPACRSPFRNSTPRGTAVMMLMTPPTALVPYRVEAEPSTTSIRRTPTVENEPRSIWPFEPGATGMPSSSTRTCAEPFVPWMKTVACAPRRAVAVERDAGDAAQRVGDAAVAAGLDRGAVDDERRAGRVRERLLVAVAGDDPADVRQGDGEAEGAGAGPVCAAAGAARESTSAASVAARGTRSMRPTFSRGGDAVALACRYPDFADRRLVLHAFQPLGP